MASSPSVWTLAVCYRSQWLAIALLRDSEVLEVRTHQLASLRKGRARIARLLARYATDYAPDLLVHDGRAPFMAIGRGIALPVATVSLMKAKHVLLGSQRATHRALFHHVLERDRRLRRLVTVLPASGRIALTEYWRTVQLVAIALGLAAATAGCLPAALTI